MSPQDFEAIAPSLEFVSFKAPEVLYEALDPLNFVYFLELGVASRVITWASGLQIEGGICGREGVFPLEALLSVNTVNDILMMQVGGEGWRLRAGPFDALLEQSGHFRRLLRHFMATAIAQTRHTAASNAMNSVEVRLARWLLMCADRVEGSTLELTQEFTSSMLAVRRPSVTQAMRMLENDGVVRSERGRVILLDRPGLERIAGDSYGAPENLYRQLIGPLPFDPAPGAPGP